MKSTNRARQTVARSVGHIIVVYAFDTPLNKYDSCFHRKMTIIFTVHRKRTRTAKSAAAFSEGSSDSCCVVNCSWKWACHYCCSISFFKVLYIQHVVVNTFGNSNSFYDPQALLRAKKGTKLA